MANSAFTPQRVLGASRGGCKIQRSLYIRDPAIGALWSRSPGSGVQVWHTASSQRHSMDLVFNLLLLLLFLDHFIMYFFFSPPPFSFFNLLFCNVMF